MHMHFKGLSYVIATATIGIVASIAGCGRQTAQIQNAVPPTVTAVTPVQGSTGVVLNPSVTATFSEPMTPGSITATSFTLTAPGGAAVAGAVTYAASGSVATFTPSANLAANTLYTATVTTGVMNQANPPNALAANYVWTFTTGTTLGTTRPAVIATNPAQGDSGIPVNQALTAAFSQAMAPSTMSATNFTLTAPGGVAVAGTVAYSTSGSVAVFTPTASLAANTLFTATVTMGATNLNGLGLAANYAWTFTTGTTANMVQPTVTTTTPVTGASAVPLNQAVSATFSKAMNPTTISTGTFQLAVQGGASVSGIVSYSAVGNTALFTPTTSLTANTHYTATITNGAKDLESNALASNFTWNFTTGTALNGPIPIIASENPAQGATGVFLNQSVNATFSEAMNPLTITTDTYQVTEPNGTVIAGTVAYDSTNFIATFTPSSPLAANTAYIATFSNGVTSTAGTPLGSGGAPNPWTFTTGTANGVQPVPLNSAASYGGFGGNSGMTNQGTSTVVQGDIGTTAASTLITGFHDNGTGCTYTETTLNVGYVNGAINTAAPPPTVGCPSEGTAQTAANAAQAALDAQTAYGDLAAIPNGMDVSTCPGCGGGSAGELGNRTLAPGVYKSAPGSYSITLGPLTLDAQGNANAVWVFQMSSTLGVGTPTSNESVLLVNGAQAKNVFWQVGSSATINGILGGGTMVGTVISQAGISVSTPGVVAITTIDGRLIALHASVTVVNTVINVPAP